MEELNPHQKAAETKRRRTREQIVNGTLDLYAGKEQETYTRDEIAEAAGIGTATLHNHFRSKYDVLNAAYVRLLMPIVEPISEGQRNGTYNPKDGVDELIRYVYSVAKVSYENRALLVELVRAYFETPPPLARGVYVDRPLDKVIGGYIALGLVPILGRNKPFQTDLSMTSFIDESHYSGITNEAILYHVNALVMEMYHLSGDEAADVVTMGFCEAVLRAYVPDFNFGDLRGKFDRIRRKVDARG
ncbi:TetR/AcrR family transcriptional regulator [Streptomyces iakyrus]|uniref:TetR/AcrR family transcriptional regulator n=1 Tax=Streptomyces iakyrus TaxID=68219 RepID=UPI0036F0ACDF